MQAVTQLGVTGVSISGCAITRAACVKCYTSLGRFGVVRLTVYCSQRRYSWKGSQCTRCVVWRLFLIHTYTTRITHITQHESHHNTTQHNTQTHLTSTNCKDASYRLEDYNLRMHLRCRLPPKSISKLSENEPIQ